MSLRVQLEDGRRKRCHQDHLRSRVVDDGDPELSPESIDATYPIGDPPSSEGTVSESSSPQDTASPEPPLSADPAANHHWPLLSTLLAT